MKSNNQKLESSIVNSQIGSSNIRSVKRTPLKMVPSTFEPPEQPSPVITQTKSRLSFAMNRTKASKQLQIQSQLQSQCSSGSFNPNIQFITSLLSNKQLIYFDEGDCVPISQNDDRWVIIAGEIKIIGVNQSSFIMKEGFVFFASSQTKRKVKQIVALSPTSAYKIPHQVFKSSIRNFLYIKNSEKIKFLQHCPFLQWPQSLSQDISLSMEPFEQIDKQKMIYNQGDEANYLYFVKEGIVLLQRNGKAGNQIILDFQKHYQTSYLGDDQALAIVRKGMVFGVDGILIKQIQKYNQNINNRTQKQQNLMGNEGVMNQNHNDTQQFLNGNIQNDSKQKQVKQHIKVKTTRIYNAKSIGKCELYKIDKNVLQTYLKAHDKSNIPEVIFSNKQLDRICSQYTNLLMGSNHIVKELKKKNFELNVKLNQTEMQFKKKRVQQIKMHQKKLKKATILNPQSKKNQQPIKQPDIPFPQMARSPRKSLKTLSQKSRDISLPSLNNKKYVQNLIFKKLQAYKAEKQSEKYMNYKKKIETTIIGKQYKHDNQTHHNAQNAKQTQKVQNSQFMSVKSYRSLLSPFS